MTSTRSIAPTASTPASSSLNLSAVLVPSLALPACLLCIPPLLIYIKGRNLPASCLLGALTLANAFSFLNAIIWPDDPSSAGYDGVGLCDVESKLFIGIVAVKAGATASILRQLSRLLRTSIPMGADSKMQRRVTLAFDFSACFGVALYSMAVHYIVQPRRYELAPIQGCIAVLDPSWVSHILVTIWPLLLYLVAAAYCLVTISRLVIHRREVSSILSVSETTRSRHYRLFALASLMLLVNFPLGVYAFLTNISYQLRPYSWSRVHPPLWSEAIKRVSFASREPWDGADQYIQIAGGYLACAFFGFSDEAKALYRSGLKRSGLSKIWKLLKRTQGARSKKVAQVLSNQAKPRVLTFIRVPEDQIDTELARMEG